MTNDSLKELIETFTKLLAEKDAEIDKWRQRCFDVEYHRLKENGNWVDFK